MAFLIKNGRVLDPASETDTIADVLIIDGVIEKIGSEIEAEAADQVVDATGCFVMPGFIDLHVHLRDPGFETKETVETGIRAALKGGFTSILAMPNTKPVVDNGDVVNYVQNKARTIGLTHVYQVGAITMNMAGDKLADIDSMVKAGAPALSEDGKSVMNAQLYRQAMALAVKYDIPILAHCEDANLVNGGVIHAGAKAAELGLKGITRTVENIIVARDLMLAQETGVRLHLCHCSTKESVAMVAAAKKRGIRVTAEVAPHHFTLTTKDIIRDAGVFKMNPPLREPEDLAALREGLKSGVMDVIATDHAPHTRQEKASSMREAAFGIVGLETAAAVTMTELVETGYLTPLQMAEKLSYRPAQIARLNGGVLAVGKVADVVIFDPQAQYKVDAAHFASKSRNTPFHGREVKGKVRYTLMAGKIAYSDKTKEK
jgi:dihydroorotase